MGCPSTSAIPSNEWFTTDQAGWDFVIAGRTGGNGGQAYIDEVTLTATIITPDGIVDGIASDDLITTGYVDAQGDTFNGPGGLANMIMAGDGNDTITGDAVNNILDGGAGNGVISCSGGSDRIFGGEGNDTVDGGAGRDTIYGDDGDDILFGGSGNDPLFGGNRNLVVSPQHGVLLQQTDRGGDEVLYRAVHLTRSP